jgi:tripartite-type tricarboxylate transporter receptor subunit TctC
VAEVVNAAVRDPQFAADVERIGLRPTASTPDEFRNIIAQEIHRWADLIKRAGIRVE